MTDEPKELMEYKTDHDLLIELRVLMLEARREIREVKDGTAKQLADHETRIRSLEDTRKANEGRTGAFSWIGGITYAIIALIAGLVGSLISSGKL